MELDKTHISVLLTEAIDGLAIDPNGCYIDCTFGRGGHSSLILSKLSTNGRLLAIDRDPSAIAAAEKFKNDHDAYIQLIINEMLPEIASQNLADYIDVFCEKGYFNVDQMVEILEAAKKHNIKSKLHLNQFNILNSIEIADK